MKGSIILSILTYITYVYSLIDYYSLHNDKVLQSCAYISNAEGFIQSKFKNFDPIIKIHFPDTNNGNNDNINIYTLIMGGEDLKKTTIGLNPYYKICDEFALNEGYCDHESDESNKQKLSLSELIDSNNYKYPIESFMLNSNGDDHIYQLDNSGVYCVLFLTSEITKDSNGNEKNFIVEVDWIQAFGNLLVSDFSRMFSSIYFAIIYFLIAIILSLLIHNKLKFDNNKTSITIDNVNLRKQRKYIIQYKFILFYWSYSSLFITYAANYYTLNKFGYNTNSFFLPLTNLLSLTMSTLITTWMIYNLILFSIGAWLVNFKTTGGINSNLGKKISIAKIVVITLGIEMLLYDVESSNIYSLIGQSKRDFLSNLIYAEYIIIMIICFLCSLLTILSITDKKIKNIYIITIILLTILFSIIIFGAYIFSSTVQASIMASSIELVFTLILTVIWYNVVYENDTLSFVV